jgi:hypothetical protein
MAPQNRPNGMAAGASAPHGGLRESLGEPCLQSGGAPGHCSRIQITIRQIEAAGR